MAALLLGALTLFSINAGRDPQSSVSGRLLLEILGPAQSVVTYVGDAVGGVWRRYFALVLAAKQNEEMKKEVALLKQQLVDMEEIKQANRRLRDLLGLKDHDPAKRVTAEVVGLDPTNHFRTMIINQGTTQGVRPQMPVINAQGVVGRVIWSSPHYAKVLLLIDPNAAVDVMVQRTRARGVAEGAGKNTLRLKYILRTEELAPGDRVISTGAAGVFPKGVLVGTVRSVQIEGEGGFQRAELEPAVNFDHLEEVVVILQGPIFAEEGTR